MVAKVGSVTADCEDYFCDSVKMAKSHYWVDLARGKRTLQCFYCPEAFMKFPALIEHLKTHANTKFRICRSCELRKRYAKRSELEERKKHTCDRKHLCWKVVTRDTLAKSCQHVFDYPEASFFREWNVKRRRRNRQKLVPLPMPDPVPIRVPVPDPEVTPERRMRPRRSCRGPLPAALGAAPPVQQPVAPAFLPPAILPDMPIVPPVPGNLPDPFHGPLDLGIDRAGGECPPPAIPVLPVVPAIPVLPVVPASVELVVPSTSTAVTPYITTQNPGFGVTGGNISDDSGGEPNPLSFLGLQPTTNTEETLGLGGEMKQNIDAPYHYFAVQPNISIIMPTEHAELVVIDNRQYYRIPATHSATGAPVFLSTPVEMGPPAVIFRQLTQFRRLRPPTLPADCAGLVPNTGHNVNMVARCYSFP